MFPEAALRAELGFKSGTRSFHVTVKNYIFYGYNFVNKTKQNNTSTQIRKGGLQNLQNKTIINL